MRGRVRRSTAASIVEGASGTRAPAEAVATAESVDYCDDQGRRYRASEELGRGVLTAVYAAEPERAEAPGTSVLGPGPRPRGALAIKTILPLWAGHPLAEARIAREHEVSDALEGVSDDAPCVRIVAAGRQACEGGTRPFHVAPRLMGATLAERLRGGRDLPADERDESAFLRDAFAWADDLLAALARVHAAGWVHRDVKPQNVFIGRADSSADQPVRAWLIDFGLAVPSGAPRGDGDEAFGTPAYVSPEVIAGAPVDPRADLYSVGLILFELFTGQRPFSSRDPVALLDAHLSEAPPRLRRLRPTRSETLDRVIHATLGKDPCERPSSATALRALLRDTPEGHAGRTPT
jgi:serine/threonine-protein kinase